MAPQFVELSDGTKLPYETLPTALDLIVGHGLGSDPSAKSHENDISTEIVKRTLSLLPAGNGTAVFYTARGHGNSSGWEEASAKEGGLDMFQWSNLALDMLEVAEKGANLETFVAVGQSMGAATALYLAISKPERIRGLVLMRPPRAWENRRACAKEFARAAFELQPFRPHHYRTLLGASETDLPPKDATDYELLSKCPILLLSHGEDEAHPIETGDQLKELLPHAQYEIADNEDMALQVWPKVIAEWLVKEELT